MSSINKISAQDSRTSFNKSEQFQEKNSHALIKNKFFAISKNIFNPIKNWHQPAKIALASIGIGPICGIGYLAFKALFPNVLSSPRFLESNASMLRFVLICGGATCAHFITRSAQPSDSLIKMKNIKLDSSILENEIEIHPEVSKWLEKLKEAKGDKDNTYDICDEVYNFLVSSVELTKKDQQILGKSLLSYIQESINDDCIEKDFFPQLVQKIVYQLLCIDIKLASELREICFGEQIVPEYIIADVNRFVSFVEKHVKARSFENNDRAPFLGNILEEILEKGSQAFLCEMLKSFENDEDFYKKFFNFFHYILEKRQSNDDDSVPDFIKDTIKMQARHLRNDNIKQLTVLRFWHSKPVMLKYISEIFTDFCENVPERAREVLIKITLDKIKGFFPRPRYKSDELQDLVGKLIEIVARLDENSTIKSENYERADFLPTFIELLREMKDERALQLALMCAEQKGNPIAIKALNHFVELSEKDKETSDQILTECDRAIEELKSEEEGEPEEGKPTNDKTCKSYFLRNIFYSFFDSRQFDKAEEVLEKCTEGNKKNLGVFLSGAIERLREKITITSEKLLNYRNTTSTPTLQERFNNSLLEEESFLEDETTSTNKLKERKFVTPLTPKKKSSNSKVQDKTPKRTSLTFPSLKKELPSEDKSTTTEDEEVFFEDGNNSSPANIEAAFTNYIDAEDDTF